MTNSSKPFDGYALTYRQGEFEVTIRNSSAHCNDFANDLAQFLLSCGYSPQNVINAFFDAAALLDQAWFDGKVLQEEVESLSDTVVDLIKSKIENLPTQDLSESSNDTSDQ
jgi:hypothetical protein